MGTYEYNYWMFRYGFMTEEEWHKFCLEYLFNNVMADKEVQEVFKRLKNA